MVGREERRRKGTCGIALTTHSHEEDFYLVFFHLQIHELVNKILIPHSIPRPSYP
jgi:hypothetical protein